GEYVLRLVADDGELSASDEVVITVNAAPEPTPDPEPTPLLSVGDGEVNAGDIYSLPIILSEAPAGVAGYTLDITLSDGSVAQIIGVDFTNEFSLSQNGVSGSQVRFSASDVEDRVRSGATDITLAILNVEGLVEGSTDVRPEVIEMDDDDGNPIGPQVLGGTLAVLNTAPIVEAGADVTVQEGDTFSGSVSFTDPGDDIWTATVDYGDGSEVQSQTLTVNTFTLNHIYTDAGVYTATVTITDDDGAAGSDTIGVHVIHTYPTLPGMSSPAQDLDGDGRAEDINGNGRLDFDDVVEFFKHMDSPAVQDNPGDFDFNGNDVVDMDDIVELFYKLVS
ncbi:MAG: PKD domain-containing protein, partial [Dehalococcoidia bacterium]